MAKTPRESPRASVTVGPLAIVWLDLWTNLYGLALELRLWHRRYAVSFGFGDGICRWKGYR